MSFLFGIFLLRWLDWLPPPAAAWLLPLLLGAGVRLRGPWRLLLCLLAGVLWAGADAQRYQGEVLPAGLEGRDLVLDGAVRGLPERQGRRLRFEFQVREAWLDGVATGFNGRVRLYWFTDPTEQRIDAGAALRLKARLKRPHGMVNPGGFDYEAWLFSRELHATGYVRGLLPTSVAAPDWGQAHHVVRQQTSERLQQAAGGLSQLGVIRALVLGDRGGLNDADWTLFRNTGTSHLMAISGLHIGLIALCGGWLGRLLWMGLPPLQRHLPRLHLAAASGWLAAFTYAGLAGFSLPTQRALIMLSVALAAVLLQRRLWPGHALGLALWLVLLLDPAAPLDAGFWLSFAAVAVILWQVAGRCGPTRGPLSWIALQWVLLLGLLPLTLIWFQQAALVSPLANALAIPWVGLAVVPLALAGTALLSLTGTDLGLLWLADQLLVWLRYLLEALASLDMLQWHRGAPAAWPLLLAVLGLAWLIAPRGWPSRWLGLLFCLPALLHTPTPPADGDFRLVLFDVGQGLSALVQTHGHSLLFDAGPAAAGGFVAARSTVLPALRHLGVERLDRLVISHSDNDHAGGLAVVTAALPVGRVQTSVPGHAGLENAEGCRAGESWRWDGVTFEMLAPSAPLFGDDNDDSCVLRVSNAAGGLLLTGDIGVRAEQRLIDSGAELSSRVLIAGHHGSDTSTSATFLAAVAPEWVLYAAGYRNRYGFPHASVRERVDAYGASSLNTADSGALSLAFTVGAGRLDPLAHRGHGEYWRVHPQNNRRLSGSGQERSAADLRGP